MNAMERDAKSGDNTPPNRVPPAEIREHLDVLMRVPWWWPAIPLMAALLSVVKMTRDASGDIGYSAQFTTITGVLVALAWLPALLQILAVIGFSGKAAGGEVSSGGLFSLL